MFKRLKKWIEELGEKNTQLYGNSKLDCCNLSLKEQEKRVQVKNK